MSEELQVTQATQAAPEENKQVEATAPKETTTPTQNKQPFKVFDSEEDFQRELKSAESRAKNDILKRLNLNSVDEGTQTITKAEQLEQDLSKAFAKLQSLEEENALVKLGVQDEYKEEALTLARARKTEDKSLEQALKEVGEKFPDLLSPTKKGVEKLGSETTDQSPADISNDALSKYLQERHPHLRRAAQKK
jgi:hypothetical protein